jgi:hypothetical protein
VRQPNAGEERTIFWDLPKLRESHTTEIVVAAPRIGFLTTLAFFANWPTNPSNQYRVTINQALIVALGRSFDDRATTVQVSETGVDAMHVQPGTPCFACHQLLDPMRDFYKQTYSLTYFEQLSPLDPKAPPLPSEGVFNMDGTRCAAAAWPPWPRPWPTIPCSPPPGPRRSASWPTPALRGERPRVRPVANVFKNSNYDWKTLLRELLSSPLVTYTARTKTADTVGVVMSIARRDNYCDRLGNRLGIRDLCNQKGESTLAAGGGAGQEPVAGNPRLGLRPRRREAGDPARSQPLLRLGHREAVHGGGRAAVDNGATARWKWQAKDQAIADFVTLLMGVPPSDPMSPKLVDILTRHYCAAIAAKEMPSTR